MLLDGAVMREPQPWIIEQIIEMLQKDTTFEL